MPKPTESVPPVRSTEHAIRAQSILLDTSTMTVVQNSDGSPMFVAHEIGSALGYGEDGRRFRDLIQGEWSDRLRPCDVTKLSGADLAPLKSAGVVAPNASSLVLLTESGLYRVLMLSGKPAALRLQEWLADDVLPTLRRTGAYGAPPRLSDRLMDLAERMEREKRFRDATTCASKAAAERRREAKVEAKKAKFDFELRRLQIACDAPVRRPLLARNDDGAES